MSQYTFDFQDAINKGYTPDQINEFIAQQKAQGNDYQLTQTPQATPQQSQQPTQGKSNWFADALPTVGGIVGGIAGAAIPVLGETGIGEIGGAAAGSGLGETAKELIEGKQLSPTDIGVQTALGGIGGVIGKGVGYAAGKILPKVGEVIAGQGGKAIARAGEMAGNVTPKVFDNVIPEDMNYVDNMTTLADTAKRFGLMEGKPVEMIPRVKQSAQLLNTQLHALPEMQNSFDVNAANDTFLKQLSDKGISPNDSKYTQAIQDTSQKILNLGKAADSAGAPQILGTDGNPIQIPGNATLSDAYKLKSLVGNDDLSRIFNKLKNPMGADLTPEERVQLGLWNSLKESIDTQGSPAIRQINTLQNHLYDIGRSYAKAAGKNAATSTFSFKDLFPLAAGGVVGGAPGAIAAEAVAKAATNPTVVGAIGKAAQGAGQVLQNGLNPVVGKVISQTAGQTVARNLLPTSPSTNYDPNSPANSNTTNQSNQSNTLPSSTSQAFGNNSTISDSGSQALPSNPNSSFQTKPPTNFMQGYTVNGAPVDSATANLIWQIVNYRVDPTKMTSLKNNERERLISLASQYDPSYTSSQFPVVQKTREDYTSGKSAQTIRSLNTAIGHLNALSQAGQGLGNSSIPLINSAKNAISQGTGNPQVNRFNTTANAVAGEMAQVFKNSGATDDEIKSWRSQLDPNMSPQQLSVAINQMIQLMGSRLSSLQSQYQTNVGKPADFTFITPESSKILQGLGIDPNSLTQQGQ